MRMARENRIKMACGTMEAARRLMGGANPF
jgi:hypothetical protein